MFTTQSEPDCLDDRTCQWLWDLTGQAWLAEVSQATLVGVRILGIVLGALLVRWLARRAIRRLARQAASGQTPAMFQQLPEEFRNGMREATGVSRVRRQQRAQAIGSVLGSAASVAVFAVAALLVLGELDVNLAPLIAGAGIIGVALGFGAQTLVRDVIAGLFMLVEDQYGIGDWVDMGEANGEVMAVGLRVTTLRDLSGVLWYVPNGEVRRLGNHNHTPAVAVVDVPIGFVPVAEAVVALQRGAQELAGDPELSTLLVEPPELLGVEYITVEGAVYRTIVNATAGNQWRVARELRRRQSEALQEAGLTDQIIAARLYPRAPGAADEAAGG